MSRFFEDAVRVFETAATGAGEGGAGELGIVIGQAGDLRIVAAAGWQPDALQAHYGARTVFHVSRSGMGVRVAGRSADSSCVLQSAAPRGGIAPACPGIPQYTILPARSA